MASRLALGSLILGVPGSEPTSARIAKERLRCEIGLLPLCSPPFDISCRYEHLRIRSESNCPASMRTGIPAERFRWLACRMHARRSNQPLAETESCTDVLFPIRLASLVR